MRRRIGIAALVVALWGILPGAATASSAAVATVDAGPYCGITWGSLPKAGGALSQAPLIATQTAQQPCWDRLVFEFDGAANGFNVAYGEVYTEGEGRALSPYTAGGALLNVQLLAPAYDQVHNTTYPHATGDHVANVIRYQTLRDVVFAGSFEGYTTFAVGVRAKLPFRVSVLSGPGAHSRIVLDVAHYWQ
jgi:hypothetical protein